MTTSSHSGTTRLTTGWLIKFLTSFTQPTKGENTTGHLGLGVGVSNVGTSCWLGTSQMRRVRYLWSWTSVSTMNVLTIITIPLFLSPLRLLFLVRLGGYIVNLYVFYSYSHIGKVTVFFSTSEVQLPQHDRRLFHFRHTALYSQLIPIVKDAFLAEVVIRDVWNWFFQKSPLKLINLCLRWWGSDCCLVRLIGQTHLFLKVILITSMTPLSLPRHLSFQHVSLHVM